MCLGRSLLLASTEGAKKWGGRGRKSDSSSKEENRRLQCGRKKKTREARFRYAVLKIGEGGKAFSLPTPMKDRALQAKEKKGQREDRIPKRNSCFR